MSPQPQLISQIVLEDVNGVGELPHEGGAQLLDYGGQFCGAATNTLKKLAWHRGIIEAGHFVSQLGVVVKLPDAS